MNPSRQFRTWTHCHVCRIPHDGLHLETCYVGRMEDEIDLLRELYHREQKSKLAAQDALGDLSRQYVAREECSPCHQIGDDVARCPDCPRRAQFISGQSK